MNIKQLIYLVGCCMLLSQAHADATCHSESQVIQTIQKSWETPSAPMKDGLRNDFAATTLALLPRAQAENTFGPISIRSSKQIQFFSRLEWVVDTDGDYWIAANSGVWIDVYADDQALTPLTFNHGLRCAGIYKALKFHLTKGVHQLLIASDVADSVKLAAALE